MDPKINIFKRERFVKPSALHPPPAVSAGLLEACDKKRRGFFVSFALVLVTSLYYSPSCSPSPFVSGAVHAVAKQAQTAHGRNAEKGRSRRGP